MLSLKVFMLRLLKTVVEYDLLNLFLRPSLFKIMKRINYFLMMILVVTLSVSCIEDEFGNVVGTWVYPEFTSFASKKMPPNLGDCEREISITFYKNLTGTLDKEKYYDGDFESDSFKYNIKEGKLTILFDQNTANDPSANSGVFTYLITGNELSLTDEAGKNKVLTRE